MRILLAAARKAVPETKRTYREDLLFVRFRGEADVRCRLALMARGAFDPSLPFDDQFCCDAQQPPRAMVW